MYTRRSSLVTRGLALILVAMGLSGLGSGSPSPAQAATPPAANTVYGQGGSFTSNTCNTGGISATSLCTPNVMVLDSSGDLYAGDSGNHRVLSYTVGSTTATRVYGQGGSFTSGTASNGGVSATSLGDLSGVALDSAGTLYVGDSSNNRMLSYPAGSTTATQVYGQGGSFTSNTANYPSGTPSASSFSWPAGVALDSAGNLYVADYNNNRVLYFAAGSTMATRVYGQPSFSANAANNGGVSASSLNGPDAVALDSSGGLYVGDRGNSRVLYYAAGSTTATRVYGQGGSFTSNIVNNGGLTSASLNTPIGMVVDSAGNLYVADFGNSRVLYYAAGSTTALRVYGQPDFDSSTANNGGVSATSLNTPTYVTVDGAGNLYVADYSNNRLLEYLGQSPPSGGGAATPELGSGEMLLMGLPATLAVLMTRRRRRSPAQH